MLTAEIQEMEPADRRGAVRRTLELRVSGQLSAGAIEAVIHDLSEHGLLLETAASLEIGERLHVALPEGGVRAAVVVWKRDAIFGCEFAVPLARSIVSAALLRSPIDASSRSGGDDTADRDDSGSLVVIVSVLVSLVAALLMLSAILGSAR